MIIKTEYISCKNRWTISSSYDFQAHQQHFQRWWCFSQTALQWFNVLPGLWSVFTGLWSVLPGLWSVLLSLWWALPGLLPVLPGAPRLVVGAPRLVSGIPRRSQVPLKDTASVQQTLGFYHPGILVWQLSDTPRCSQWPKYILLMVYGDPEEPIDNHTVLAGMLAQSTEESQQGSIALLQNFTVPSCLRLLPSFTLPELSVHDLAAMRAWLLTDSAFSFTSNETHWNLTPIPTTSSHAVTAQATTEAQMSSPH